MTLIKGLDLPVVDYLAILPYAAVPGTWVVADPRGIPDPVTGKRYAYIVRSENMKALSLYRADLESRTIEQLADAPAPAAGDFQLAGLAALMDPTGGAASDRPKIYVLVGLSLAPFIQWMSYDIRTGLWNALLDAMTVPGLAAAPTTCLSLAHPCGTLGATGGAIPNAAEVFIYANGDAGAWDAAGPSRLMQYNKAANTWAVLTGIGGVRAAAPAAGSRLLWTPTYPDRLYSPRGGGATLIDVYFFSTNAWVAVGTNPAVTMDEGTSFTTIPVAFQLAALRRGGANLPLAERASIYRVDLFQAAVNAPETVELLASMETQDGTNHEGQDLVTWLEYGAGFVGALPKSGSQLQRIQIPWPM